MCRECKCWSIIVHALGSIDCQCVSKWSMKYRRMHLKLYLSKRSHIEHCGVGIDCRTHNCVVTLVPKSSNGGIDVKDVGQGFDVRNLLIVCRLIWLNDLGCHCIGVIEDTGACNASSSYSTFRPEAGRDQLGEVFCVQL